MPCGSHGDYKMTLFWKGHCWTSAPQQETLSPRWHRGRCLESGVKFQVVEHPPTLSSCDPGNNQQGQCFQQNQTTGLSYASGRKKKFHFVALSKGWSWSPLLPPRCPGQSPDFPTSQARCVLCLFLKKTLGIPFFGFLQWQGANCPQLLAYPKFFHNKPTFHFRERPR